MSMIHAHHGDNNNNNIIVICVRRHIDNRRVRRSMCDIVLNAVLLGSQISRYDLRMTINQKREINRGSCS